MTLTKRPTLSLRRKASDPDPSADLDPKGSENRPPRLTWKKKHKTISTNPLKPPPIPAPTSPGGPANLCDVFNSPPSNSPLPPAKTTFVPHSPPSPDLSAEATRRGSHPTPCPSRTRRVNKGRLRFLDLAIKPRNFGFQDINLPRITPAFDNLVNPTLAREKKATQAALALRSLILDPHSGDITPPAASHNTTPTKKGSSKGPIEAITRATISLGILFQGKPDPDGVSTNGTIKPPPPLKNKSKFKTSSKSSASKLRGKNMNQLRSQLLQPNAAALVIQTARSLPISDVGPGVEQYRAVCLDTPEIQAEGLIDLAKKHEQARRLSEAYSEQHKYSTIKSAPIPNPPPRLPVLLSLFTNLPKSGAVGPSSISSLTSVLLQQTANADPMPFGLFQPACALSLSRPLAGALPSVDTLRQGFDALLNTEEKIYQLTGPNHQFIHPPLDRISVFTYWWGFELALPPTSLDYLARCKSIATSVLNLLSVIVYAVPGGTRELAPFVGVLSRFIESEWLLLKSQDKGQGVVCGATWFLPAAIVARPWDYGVTPQDRDKLVGFNPKKA